MRVIKKSVNSIFEEDQPNKMQEIAEIAKKRAIGNAKLVNEGAKPVKIRECTF
jgi:hypothetical protein